MVAGQRTLAAAARRSLVLKNRWYHASALQKMGAKRPPLPPFARNPKKEGPVSVSCWCSEWYFLVETTHLVLLLIFFTLNFLCDSFHTISVFPLQIPENYDTVWDDGVAPELALDFDAPHISTQEALISLAICFSGIFCLFQGINLWTRGAKDDNPALHRHHDIVVKDYSNYDEVPYYVAKKEEEN